MAPKAPAAPAAKPEKGAISAFLGSLKVGQAAVDKMGDAATALNKRKAEALAFYQSLPRQDARKHELIQNFAQDKGMTWWESYSKVTKSSNAVESDRVKGYGSKAQSMLWFFVCFDVHLFQTSHLLIASSMWLLP